MCAGLLVVGALIAFRAVRKVPEAGRGAQPECTMHCGVTAPPLEPERRPRHT